MQRICYFSKLQKLFQKSTWVRRNMSSFDNLIDDARKIYLFSVQAVQPNELIRNSVHIQSNEIEVQGKSYPINRNAYVVGFGKAVLGMAVTLENLLQDHLISGIISVPVGTLNENTRYIHIKVIFSISLEFISDFFKIKFMELMFAFRQYRLFFKEKAYLLFGNTILRQFLV